MRPCHNKTNKIKHNPPPRERGKRILELGIVVHAFRPSTGKAEARGSYTLGQLVIHDKGLSEGGRGEWNSHSQFFIISAQVYLVILLHKALKTKMGFSL